MLREREIPEQPRSPCVETRFHPTQCEMREVCSRCHCWGCCPLGLACCYDGGGVGGRGGRGGVVCLVHVPQTDTNLNNLILMIRKQFAKLDTKIHSK